MTIKQIYEKAEFDLDKNKITIGEFAKIIGQEVVIIPENATNGDMIKALFPNAEFWDSTEFENEERINFEDNDCLECLNLDWWNAPYKENKG